MGYDVRWMVRLVVQVSMKGERKEARKAEKKLPSFHCSQDVSEPGEHGMVARDALLQRTRSHGHGTNPSPRSVRLRHFEVKGRGIE